MAEFRVTFGQRYRNEPHPLGWPHPDGWLSVIADNYDIARGVTEGLLKSRFAFMYSEGDYGFPTEDAYPMGELMKLVITTESAQLTEPETQDE